MSQRFYPYTAARGEPIYCEAANCTNVAMWWESPRDAIWCDFHATSELVAPVRVQCDVCLDWYNPTHIHEGVCRDCRSVMPLLWTDVPEHEVQQPDDDLYGFPRDVDQIELG